MYEISDIEMGDETYYYEAVYALDTNYDPAAYTRECSDWDGHVPAGGVKYLTPAGDSAAIPVTGGGDYALSVSVSFSYPNAVSVSLGVSKIPAPKAYLHLTSTRDEGYVETVGFDGFVESYSHWI